MSLYFRKEYGLLYEEHEQAEFQQFEHHSSDGDVTFSYLKREIPYKINGETYYDIISPYGYGGPMIVEASNKQKAYQQFENAFKSHCENEKIVSEFVRFHPYKNDDLLDWYSGEVIHHGPIIVRDLRLSNKEEFSKSVMKDYRKSVRNGLTVEFDEEGKCLEEYLEIYYSTMKRNHANSYYYFERSFFEKVIDTLPGAFVFILVRLEGKVISAGLLLYGDSFSYGFLGGTDKKYFSYQPTTFLEVESIGWLKDKNNDYYVLGGGFNGEDGIFKFKKKYAATGKVPFYLGKKIINPDIYQHLKKIHEEKYGLPSDASFFPAYRASAHELETAKG